MSHALLASSGLPGSHRAAMLLGRHTSAFKYPQQTSHGVRLSEGARHALHPNLEINRSNWIKMFIVIRAVYRLWWLRSGENKRSQEARISTSPLYSTSSRTEFLPLRSLHRHWNLEVYFAAPKWHIVWVTSHLIQPRGVPWSQLCLNVVLGTW